MKRLLLFAGPLGGAAIGLLAWLRRKRPEPVVDAGAPAVLAATDPGTPDVERWRDEETTYDRAAEDEAATRHEVAQRVRSEPLAERLETPPDSAA